MEKPISVVCTQKPHQLRNDFFGLRYFITTTSLSPRFLNVSTYNFWFTSENRPIASFAFISTRYPIFYNCFWKIYCWSIQLLTSSGSSFLLFRVLIGSVKLYATAVMSSVAPLNTAFLASITFLISSPS